MRILLEAPLGIRDADHAEQLERAGARLRRRHAEVDLGRLGQLTPHGEDGVQRGHRLLEDHADLAPADVAHLGVREAQEIAALEEDLAAYDAAGWRRHEAHDAEGAHGLAAAGLAHEGHRLPLANVPGHAVDRADDAGRRRELCLEVPHFEENVTAPLHGPGSLAHRSKTMRRGPKATAASIRKSRGRRRTLHSGVHKTRTYYKPSTQGIFATRCQNCCSFSGAGCLL